MNKDQAVKRLGRAFDPLFKVCGILWVSFIPLIIGAVALLIYMLPRTMEDGKGMSIILLIFIMLIWAVPFSIWAELKHHIDRSARDLEENSELSQAVSELEDKDSHIIDNKYTIATSHYIFLHYEGEILAYDRLGWYCSESFEDGEDEDEGENCEKRRVYYLKAGRDGQKKGYDIFLGEQATEETVQSIIDLIEPGFGQDEVL